MYKQKFYFILFLFLNQIYLSQGIDNIQPTNLHVNELTLNKIEIIWDYQEICSNFELWFKNEQQEYKLFAKIDNSVRNYILERLNSNTEYYFKIRTYVDNKYSDFSNEIKIMTSPDKPTDLVATEIFSTKVKLTWNYNGNFSGIKIWRKKNDSEYKDIYSIDSSKDSYIDKGLIINTEYMYKLQPFNGNNNGDFSDEIRVITLDDKPTDLFATAISSNKVKLEWNYYGDMSGFIIWRRTFDSEYKIITRIDISKRTYIDKSLYKNTDYMYKIQSYNPSQVTDFSNEILVKTF